ncbi:serine/threonine-protein kinase [Streptomyces broussonetiae]|uniref:Protein kinase n=1 Tax=Streptomyces broussonetiae TaxID=2686304 RepID=A0A6I6N1Z0_9ACTN|nr:serine/threonine-protein kinase [Streptomyces broussonetiae]QHA07188.1 protein kinase [Streptomyces broussonetiae]
MPTPLTHDDPVALGPFRLIARLGSGGMGTVYVARSTGGRTVALKTMHAAIATDPAARTRFRLEVDAARVIGDRFGARVMDADPLAETPWLATEYVLGPPLDEAVEAGGTLPEQSVRALGAALCSALGQLHRSDVVHRDLKPSNILLTAYGPKVIDFGIARAIGDERLTRAGAAVGTPAFMSPEQATGQEHGAAGDVFALAGVLVYTATGRGPFGSGQAADLLYRVRYADADLTGVPVALAPVLAQCLAKDPGQRPTMARLAAQLHDGTGEFADHLPHELLAEIGRRAADVWRLVPQRLPAPAAGPEAAAVTGPAARRPSRRRFLAVGGALAVGAAAGAGAWWWQGRADARGGGGTTAKGDADKTRNIEPLWTYTFSAVVTDQLGSVVPQGLGGMIIVAAGGGAEAVRATNGVHAWDGNGLSGESSWQTLVTGGRLYRLWIGEETSDGIGSAVRLQTLDPKNGKTIKTLIRFAGTNDELPTHQLLCITDRVAYVVVGKGKYDGGGTFSAGETDTLSAADIETGKLLWSQPLPVRFELSSRLHFLAAKTVGSRLVTLQQLEDGTVHIVVWAASTGAVLWKRSYDIDDPDILRCGIAADNDHLYLGGSRLWALRLSDGAATWQTSTEHAYGPPVLREGILYAVGDGAGLTAVDARSGRMLWTERGGEVGEASTSGPPILGTRYAYYKNGSLLRAVSLSDHTTSLTYQTSGKQFYGDSDAKLVLAVDGAGMTAYPLQ